MVEMVAERGFEAVTVRGLTRLAGVSTRSFYQHFDNAEECFAATYDSLMQNGLCRTYAAQTQSGDWPEDVRAALGSLMGDLASFPNEARLVLVEAYALGAAMQSRMNGAIGAFEQLLTDSLVNTLPPPAATRYLSCGVAAGAMRVARRRLLTGEVAELANVRGELGDWAYTLCGESVEDLELSEVQATGPAVRPAIRQATEKPSAAIRGAPGDEHGRILAAVAKLGAAGGFASLTIPRIRTEAGVSRRSFDACFADLADCFLESIEALVASAAARAERQVAAASRWESGIHRAVGILCEEVARNPTFARLAFTEILMPGRDGLQRRERLISIAASRLRSASPLEQMPSELATEASVAAVWRIVHSDIAAGRARTLPRLAPLLTYVLLTPMVGPETAAELIRDERACTNVAPS
jgi:AcrR family transcriptional regulator